MTPQDTIIAAGMLRGYWKLLNEKKLEYVYQSAQYDLCQAEADQALALHDRIMQGVKA